MKPASKPTVLPLIASIITLTVLMLAVSACQPAEISLRWQLAQTRLPSTTPFPTIAPTLTPSLTPTATVTPSPTLTLTPSMTFTPSATPFSGFEEGKLNSARRWAGEITLVFTIPGVSHAYTLVVERRQLACDINAYYPNILVCVGPDFALSSGTLTFDFYLDEAREELAYSGTFYNALTVVVQPTPLPWVVSWSPDNNCERRGEEVSCETEYRLYPDGPCMAASCYDACGYYYSIDNCSYEGSYTFIPRPPGPGWDPLEAIP
jgi:hypothetical protein